MPLTMRPTGLGHGVYKDSIDYGVFSGEWQIGRIYERRGFPDDVRWSWSLWRCFDPPASIRTGTRQHLKPRRVSSGQTGSNA